MTETASSMQATGKTEGGRVPCSPTTVALRADGRLEVTTTEGSSVPTAKWKQAVDQWRSLIDSSAAKHGVAPAIIAAIMHAESGGDPSALSPAGALGLMQLMPGTYNALAGKPTNAPVDRQEAMRPEVNVDLGGKLLASNMARYAGNLINAAVSYNAGSPRCGECTCWSSKGCAPDPWGVATDCSYLEHVVGAYNAAVEQGYSWRVPPRTSAVYGSKVGGSNAGWIVLGVLGAGLGVLLAAVAVK